MNNRETVAVVVVTYNRADLLKDLLGALAEQTRAPEAVYVVNNASTDDTAAVLEAESRLPLTVVHAEGNLGGAGGFERGLRTAHAGGHDRFWLIDDDVLPAHDCLEVLMREHRDCLMVVREDKDGNLCEKAATRFDLESPFIAKPKRAMVEDEYATREDMPALVPLENVAFEGFMLRRTVIDAIGLPDPNFFIFYDDVDYALRARAAGFSIYAVRDAVVVRQLDFNQQHDLDTWKGYYMYRNLFAVHRRYGANALVRAKPWMLTLLVVVLSPLRGGRAEARNVIRAMRAVREMPPVPSNSGLAG